MHKLGIRFKCTYIPYGGYLWSASETSLLTSLFLPLTYLMES